jgi:tetratricopeptide (TPR) repeat protein
MKSILMRITLISFLLLLLIPNHTSAELKTFVKEYTYQASDFDSRISSRTISLETVKRLLLEELGTYLVSETEVKNMQLTKDQVTTYSAGIVGAEVIDEKWDGKIYWLKAKVSADPKEVEKSLKKLILNRSKIQELEDIRRKADELTKENERLRKELQAGSRTGKEYATTEAKNVTAYNNTIKGLTAVDWVEKGLIAYKSDRLSEAISAYTKAIEVKPDYARAYSNRAGAYNDFGNYQQAIQDSTKAIDIDPGDAVAYNNRAAAYNWIGNYLQAMQDSTKGIELAPDFAEAYDNRGCAYGGLGNNQQAIKDFNRAIELRPDAARSYNNRGNAYDNLGNYQQAIRDYTKAIELKPDLAAAYCNRGVAYYKIDKHQQAVNDLKIAARLGDINAQNNLIKLRVQW